MSVPRHLAHFFLFLLLAAVVLHYAPRYISSEPSETYIGKVVGITDGNTLTLLVDRQQVKVRLAEIDTPERAQPFGTRAKQALSDLAYGKEARVVVIDVDRYGRTVGRVYVHGTDVNAELVRQGYAWVYRKYAEDPELYELEEEARKAERGLWAHPGPVPPWEWRRGVRPSSQTLPAQSERQARGLSCDRRPYCEALAWIAETEALVLQMRDALPDPELEWVLGLLEVAVARKRRMLRGAK